MHVKIFPCTAIPLFHPFLGMARKSRDTSLAVWPLKDVL